MKKALFAVSTAATSIALAFAQTQIIIGNTAQQSQVNGGAILGLLALAQTIVARLVPFAIGLAVLALFWFIIEFVWKGRSDPEAKSLSLKGMGYAVLAIFIMVSIWGIVGFLGSIVGIGQGGSVPTPGIPVPAA